MIKTVEEGASTQVWAAVARELDGAGGLYLEDCAISKLSTPEQICKEQHGYTDFAVIKENDLKLWDISTQCLKNPPK